MKDQPSRPRLFAIESIPAVQSVDFFVLSPKAMRSDSTCPHIHCLVCVLVRREYQFPRVDHSVERVGNGGVRVAVYFSRKALSSSSSRMHVAEYPLIRSISSNTVQIAFVSPMAASNSPLDRSRRHNPSTGGTKIGLAKKYPSMRNSLDECCLFAEIMNMQSA